jgi:class 3 adenylate cyclase
MAHRVTFGVDIEGYSKRRDPEQVELQARLCWITKEALKAAGVKARQCERQNQGDGQLISLPQVIDMKSVLPALPLAMQAAIHRVNAVPSPAGQLRMRMSIAQGPVQTASTGYVGPGVIAASRMLDSQLLRDTLRDNTGADLVLMVTDDLYQQVYRQGYSGLAAPGFRDAQLENKAKNYAARVWIYVASGPPDTKLVPAFAGTGTPGGNVAAMWDVAIPAAGIGVAMWVHQHDAHQHDAHQHDAHQHHDHLEAHQPELGHLDE